MCGIAGIFHLETAKPVDPARLKAMSDAIVHRGPDGEGQWIAPGIGLGHRRLSIIDLAGGAQPMASADDAQIIVFNGEIYNFIEVRKELEACGHAFRTSSDTEVILAAWRQWGTECLSRLNGMFAFALYDQRQRQLFLARDRLGVKPLYYAPLSDGSVIFASELKGLLVHPLLRRKPDIQAVDDYLAFGYVPDDRCFVAGVRKLPAGHYLLLQQGKPLPEPQRWWSIDFTRRAKGSTADLEAELLHHMREGVASRMIADVPLGAFLSGGVDSSSVVALMAERSRQPVKSCSIGFDQALLDESDYARQIATKFGTDHRSRIVSSDDMAIIDTVAGHFDEPFADSSMLPTYQVCAMARETVTVALSGDGADEALAGYRRQVFHHHEERMRSLLPAAFRQPVFGALGALYPKADWAPRPLRAKATLLSLARNGAEGYADAVGVTAHGARQLLYADSQNTALGGYRAEDRLVTLMQNAPVRSGLDAAQYADLTFWLTGDILTKVDRTSMAVSLEAREPLLDYRLIEFCATLPESMRVKGRQGKWLMKRAMRHYLPEDILYRPKMGFVTPIAHWYRTSLADEARAIARGSALARTGWFSGARLEALAEAHIAGRSDNSRQLWQLWMLDKALKRVFAL
ncbi:MAG: amidotransferase 1, exosortase A system-associated [Blastomonas sp.]